FAAHLQIKDSTEMFTRVSVFSKSKPSCADGFNCMQSGPTPIPVTEKCSPFSAVARQHRALRNSKTEDFIAH
ncbi:MAG: hypothetical protein ABSF34_19045, partial [Verrucomicrobiota bacterium]